MWIIRFHLLKPKEYNKVSRICKKYGFYPRKIPSIIFAKAVIIYLTQNKSWRTISKELGVCHIQLHTFFKSYKNKEMIREIFHTFIKSSSCLYIGSLKDIDLSVLDNNQEIITLTNEAVKDILKKI